MQIRRSASGEWLPSSMIFPKQINLAEMNIKFRICVRFRINELCRRIAGTNTDRSIRAPVIHNRFAKCRKREPRPKRAGRARARASSKKPNSGPTVDDDIA